MWGKVGSAQEGCTGPIVEVHAEVFASVLKVEGPTEVTEQETTL